MGTLERCSIIKIAVQGITLDGHDKIASGTENWGEKPAWVASCHGKITRIFHSGAGDHHQTLWLFRPNIPVIPLHVINHLSNIWVQALAPTCNNYCRKN